VLASIAATEGAVPGGDPGEVALSRAPLAARAAPYVALLLDAVAAEAAAAPGAAPAGAAAAVGTAAGGPAELSALRAYLGGSLGSPQVGAYTFIREAVWRLEGPANPGGSFLALLGRPLVRLGRLSGRQVHAEALEFERRRWGGRLPPFVGASTPSVRAALDAAELSDFHTQVGWVGAEVGGGGWGRGWGGLTEAPCATNLLPSEQSTLVPDPSAHSRSLPPSHPPPHTQLAAFDSTAGGKSRRPGPGWAPAPVASVSDSFEEGPDGAVSSWGAVGPGAWPPGVPRRCAWRWRGALTDYCFAEPADGAAAGPDAPAIVLCHGFGAFGDQWRGNLGALAAAGYRVYAPTLPGFGRSEKAPIGYSQEAW
jgi:hypothetical protein